MTPEQMCVTAREALDQALTLDWPKLDLSPIAKSWLLGQAWGESRFGLTPEWKGSNNYGAVTYHLKDGKFIEHADHDANGKPVIYKFQAYDSQLAGCREWLKVIMRGKVPEALDGGTAHDVATAMKRNGYYTGIAGSEEDRIVAYTSLILTNAAFVSDLLAAHDSGVDLSTTKALQARLLVLGYDPHGIDGVMGNHTIDAIKRFQLDHGLKPDGIVGPLTRAALRSALVKSL